MATPHQETIVKLIVLSSVLIAEARAQTAPDGDALIAARNAAVHAALGQTTSVEYLQVPLNDVALHLAELHKIRITIDRRALAELGHGVDTPISRLVKNVRLSSLLHLILDDLDMAYIVRDGNLRITSQDEADKLLAARVYAVQDLNSDPLGEADYDALIELIKTTIAVDTWDDAGGPGSMARLRGTLIVSQTQEVQQEVAALLAAFRTLRKQLKAADGSARLQVVHLFDSPQEQAVRRVLRDSRARINANDASLLAIVDFLRDKHGVEFQFHWRALDASEVGVDARVTAVEDDTPLGVALSRVLGDVGLAYVVQHDVVRIGPAGSAWADTVLEPRLYPVEDLVVPIDGLGEPDYDALIEAIKTTVAVDTWDDAGGPGSVAEFYSPHCLVIAQTEEVHREIEALFKQLRAKADQAPQLGATDGMGRPAAHCLSKRTPRACPERLPNGWPD